MSFLILGANGKRTCTSASILSCVFRQQVLNQNLTSSVPQHSLLCEFYFSAVTFEWSVNGFAALLLVRDLKPGAERWAVSLKVDLTRQRQTSLSGIHETYPLPLPELHQFWGKGLPFAKLNLALSWTLGLKQEREGLTILVCCKNSSDVDASNEKTSAWGMFCFWTALG